MPRSIRSVRSTRKPSSQVVEEPDRLIVQLGEKRDYKIHVIVPTYKAGGWGKTCVESLRSQTVVDWECIIIDDASAANGSQDSLQYMIKAIDGDPRFTLIENKHRQRAMRNKRDAIMMLSAGPEDIICIVDGDDYLHNPNVFQTMLDTYAKEDCLTTYGGMIYCGEFHTAYPYPAEIIANNTYRSEWHATPLRTFKYWLWQHIPQDRYFKWTNGRWLTETSDQAMMNCILELAGGRYAMFNEPMYVVGAYARSSDIEQLECLAYIRSLPALPSVG